MIFIRIIESELKLKVIKEFQFHPKRKWRFDYCIPELKIAIEVEGGAWTQGRHTRGKGFIEDMLKYNTAVCMGWRLLRFTPDELMKTATIEAIRELMKLKTA